MMTVNQTTINDPPAKPTLSPFTVDIFELDANLPEWARRRHPVVRRHLGLHWRIMPPQHEPIIRWFLIETAVVLLTIPIAFLFTLLLPLVMISLAILPAALFYYGRMLYDIAADTSRQMVIEVENHTLALLLATPMPRRELLLAKIAGALWKQSESFGLLMIFAAVTQIPSILLLYTNLYTPTYYEYTAQFLTIGVFASSLIRIPLEMFMVAALGLYMGRVTHGKSAASASTIGVAGFYFMLINLTRLIPLPPLGRLFTDAILPCLAAALITWLLLRMTERELRAD